MTNKEAPTLLLPKRFEKLKSIAEQNDADLTRIVRKVPGATARIERLLKAVRDGGLGRFEFFLGKSGSGKTTFLSTLPKFYHPVNVTPILDTVRLEAIPDFIRDNYNASLENQVFILLELDNPNFQDSEIRIFFESLRRLFRESKGQILVIWPITDELSAKRFAEIAWTVGRDSIVDLSSKGTYIFEGLSKDDYYSVSDITTRTLNAGQSLESFGLSPEKASPLLVKSETISEYFSYLEEKSQEINKAFDKLLQERTIPSVWVLLLGDDSRELNLTVATLTQGMQKQPDIDRFIAVLDDSSLDAAYLKEWKKRRGEIAYILRRLDVRLFEVSPNVVLAAARAFGDDAVKSKLNKPKGTKAEALRTIQNARFFQALASQPSTNISKLPSTAKETTVEYQRIQVLASKNDKILNKSIADSISAGLSAAGIAASVVAEKRSIEPGSNLQPDILVTFPDGKLVCLELTWRTTGKPIPGGTGAQQNTMTVGHIQQYFLAKVLEYVNDLNM